jgi:hypothetical protein
VTKIVPIVVIVIGLFMWRFPARSRFNRTNQYGVEEFTSYGHMRGRRFFEGLIRFSGAILILFGIGQFIVPERYSYSHIGQPVSEEPVSKEPARHHGHG